MSGSARSISRPLLLRGRSQKSSRCVRTKKKCLVEIAFRWKYHSLAHRLYNECPDLKTIDLVIHHVYPWTLKCVLLARAHNCAVESLVLEIGNPSYLEIWDEDPEVIAMFIHILYPQVQSLELYGADWVNTVQSYWIIYRHIDPGLVRRLLEKKLVENVGSDVEDDEEAHCGHCF
ncbi:hypothetical protein BC835DRAFT_485681 [Cytidiella melzeri]|nr:hypothetical protein BC835DRAFT_485681 [Cytidiella melzeri]